MLGVILPDIGSPFYSEVIHGVEQEANAQGYYLVLCTTCGKPSREEMHLRLLWEHRVDGLLLVTPRGNEPLIQEIRKHGFPVVVVDRDMSPQDDVVEVIVDNFHGAIQAMEHLIHCGYRRIGFINGLPDIQASQERLRGYRIALQEHGLPFSSRWIVHSDFTERGGYVAMKNLLSISPHLDAVFVANDWMAVGALWAIREAGLRVPDDMGVVGFDDVPLAAQTDPPLTTVRQPMRAMGALGVKLLVQLIQGEKVTPTKFMLQTELVVRGSTRRIMEEKQGEEFRREVPCADGADEKA
jgi:LacI family transcriptional regulator